MAVIVVAGALGGGLEPKVHRAFLRASGFALMAFAAYALWPGSNGWARL